MAKISVNGTEQLFKIKLSNKIIGTGKKVDGKFIVSLKGSKETASFSDLSEAAQHVSKLYHNDSFNTTVSALSEETKSILSTIINTESICIGLDNLAARWNEEKEYEDFADYENVIIGLFSDFDIKITKCTKRPFGIIAEFEGRKVKIFRQARGEYVSLAWKTA